MKAVSNVFHNHYFQANKTVREKGNWEDQLEPYRSENTKLIRENNELHTQHIRLKDELDATSKDLKVSIISHDDVWDQIGELSLMFYLLCIFSSCNI